MTRRVPRAASLLLAVAAAGTGECRAAEPARLHVEVLSRAVAPGEPIRVIARSPVALAALGATFLEREVFMMPAAPSVDGEETWVGWSLVGLLQEPTLATIDLHGRGRDGRTVRAALAVRIEAKEFPVEELSVAPKYVSPPPGVQERIAADRARLAAIYRRRTAVATRGPFVRPVPGEPTGVFGARRVFNGEPRSPHSGLDLRAAEGAPVAVSGPGTVVLAHDLYYSGNTVIVDHGGGLFTLYAHLSRMDVREGDELEAGAPVGLAGATGRVTGPHLHWGAKIGDEPFDPRALLDAALFP